jgi:hypothetical protein
MATVLGDNTAEAKILGDDQVVPLPETVDPNSASTERRDTAVLGATGKLPEELENIPSLVSEEVQTALATQLSSLTETYADVEDSAEDLQDQAGKGSDLVTVADYFDNSFHAMQNPTLSKAQNLAAMKYQLTVEKLTDAIQARTAETTAGSVLNWVDRYMIRQFPIGAFEDLTMKRKTVSEEFSRAIAGNMSMEEYDLFLSDRLGEFLEQGVLFADNPMAVQDLLGSIEKFGNDDFAVAEALLGAVDLLPIASGVVGTTARVGKAASRTVQAQRLAKTINAISKSPTAATRAGAINGPEAATRVAENIAARSDDMENLAGMGPRITDPMGDKAPVRPLGEAAARNHTAMQVTKEAYEYVNSALGDIFDASAINAYITSRVANLNATLNRGVMDIALDQNAGRITVTMGHPKTGKAITREAAEKYAEDVPEASVVAIDETKGAYGIQVSEVINMDQFVKTDNYSNLLEVEGVSNKLFNKLFQKSPFSGFHLKDNQNATNLAYRAESGAVRLSQIQAPMLDKINKLSGRQIDEVGSIIERLQSKDLASKRNWFTEDEFVDMWKASHKGVEPSTKVKEGYKALVDLADHTYTLRATSMIKRMHADGYRRIAINVGGEVRYTAGKQVDKLPEDVKQFIDAKTGVKFFKSEYDGPVANVFKIDMDIGGVDYVVDTDVVQPLNPSDALGYNAGGPRINPEATDFVLLLDGKGKPLKVALSASSTKSAGLAANQMDTLYRSLKAGNLTDDVVKANNKWNPSITTVSQFDEFLQEVGLDLTPDGLQFGTKVRDEPVFTGAAEDLFVPGASLDEFALYSNRRNDVPLTHFGGRSTVNDNPINGILNQANTEARKLAFSTYNQAVEVSLGKKVKQIVAPDSSDVDYRKYYRNMESLLPKESRNPVVNTLLERKRITELRNGADGWRDRWLTNLTQSLSNVVYDTIGVKFNPSNPAHAVNNFGFKTTFFGDPFQMLLQSAHSANIVAMAGLDDGLQGMNMGRILLNSLNLEGKQLDIVMERLGKLNGYTKDEMVEIRQLFIDMARYEVDPTNYVDGFQAPSNSVSRLRGANARAVGNTVGKAWEKTTSAGLYFFNKGEQISRVSGFGAAVRKWKAQNKGKSILSDEGRTWVSNKEQAYTLQMTNMSRGMAQQGLLRVPTQFYSYMLRSFEAVFIGKDLTPAERMKLAVMVGPFWGMTGVGATKAASPMAEALNSYLPQDAQIEPGSDAYRLIKNGPVDALFAWAGDTLVGDAAPEVSTASRLSLGDGVVDTFRNYRDASPFELLAGAGGGKAGGALVDLAQTLGAIKRGDEILIQEKSMELFRSFKFVDNIAKAVGILHHNVYSSRTGNEVDARFNNLDALFALAGVPLEEVQQVYDSKDIIYNSNKVYRQYSKEIDNRINSFWRAVNDRDTELANQHMESIQLSVSRFTGLTPEQRSKLSEQVMRGFSETTTFERVEQLRSMGREFEAEQLLQTTE